MNPFQKVQSFYAHNEVTHPDTQKISRSGADPMEGLKTGLSTSFFEDGQVETKKHKKVLKLLVAPGLTRSKDATNGAPGITSSILTSNAQFTSTRPPSSRRSECLSSWHTSARDTMPGHRTKRREAQPNAKRCVCFSCYVRSFLLLVAPFPFVACHGS